MHPKEHGSLMALSVAMSLPQTQPGSDPGSMGPTLLSPCKVTKGPTRRDECQLPSLTGW